MKLKRKQINFLLNAGITIIRCLIKDSDVDVSINHSFIKEGINILEKRTLIYDDKNQLQKIKYYRANLQKINTVKKYISSIPLEDFRLDNYIKNYSKLDKEAREMVTYLILIYLHQYGKLKRFIGELANSVENKESDIIKTLVNVLNKDINKLNKDIYYFAVDFDYRNFIILNK